jgi:hypothetical protein
VATAQLYRGFGCTGSSPSQYSEGMFFYSYDSSFESSDEKITDLLLVLESMLFGMFKFKSQVEATSE